MTPATLAGQRVFVAGGTGNVGRELVASLLQAGATVAVSSRSAERLESLRSFAGEGSADRLVTIAGDIADDADGARIRAIALQRLGGLDTAIASLGTFVTAHSLLATAGSDLRRVLESYVVVHHSVARTLIPALMEHGGSYVFINGMLGFGYVFPGAALVSVAGSAQARWTQLVMQELEPTNVRANELVLYSSFGRDNDEELNRGRVGKSDVTEFVAQLISSRGAHVRGQSIHLKSREAMALLADSSDGVLRTAAR